MRNCVRKIWFLGSSGFLTSIGYRVANLFWHSSQTFALNGKPLIFRSVLLTPRQRCLWCIRARTSFLTKKSGLSER
jgi:hypothetical protein